MKQSVVFLIVALLAASLFAAVPQTILYQGRLTTPAGEPVADGAYLIQFRIYDAAAGGATLWDNGYRTVPVLNGLFTYQLGDSTALPSTLFEDTARWLGVKVGADAEITPRVKLASFAYAFHALSADTAYAIAGDPFVDEVGDNMTGALTFIGSVPESVAKINPHPADRSADFFLYDRDAGSNATAALFGDTYGELALSDPNGVATADVNAGTGGGGWLQVKYPNASRTIGLYSQYAGDNSAAFPNNAINEDELLNEPGVAAKYLPSTALPTTADVVLDSVEVTVPTSGYLLVMGSGIFSRDHISGSGNTALRVSVGQTRTISIDNGTVWFVSSAWATEIYYCPFSVNCLSPVSAGTAEVFLVADAFEGSGAVSSVHLTALFFPTAYGTVESTKSSGLSSATADGSDLPAPEIYDARSIVEAERAARLEQQRLDLEAQLNEAQRDEDKD